MFYLFRSTTANLTGHLEHIEESGDSVLGLAFVGEKHWIIVCRKGELEPKATGVVMKEALERLNQAPKGYHPGGVIR